MITFPPEFVATKYPGYFFNIQTKTLFSIKVSGILTELKKSKPTAWNEYFNGYVVSVHGVRKKLKMEYLEKLEPTATVIPMAKR